MTMPEAPQHLPGELMLADMNDSPAVVEALVPRVAALLAGQAIPERPWARVVFSARGSSENACLIAESRFPLSARAAVSVVSPSVLAHGDLPQDMTDWLVFAVSQSGKTPEVCTAADRVRSRGAFVVAITNEAASPLAHAADLAVALGAGAERVIAATKTVVAQTVALLMLTEALGTTRDAHLDWESVPEIIRQALDQAITFPKCRIVAIVGRGSTIGVAREGALKVMETSGAVVYGGSAYDFVHGPTAILNSETSVVALSATPAGQGDVAPLVAAAEQRGAELVVWGATPQGPMEFEPVRLLVLVQRLAHHNALIGGGDPDDPRGLSKVTVTL